MATSKVRIAARLRPRLPNELHDDGVRVCHGEPANASCSNSNTGGANTSLNPNNSASLAGANASNSSSGSASSSGSFTGIAVANPRDASQVFHFPFTSCYDADATQAAIFDADVRPLVDVALGGVTVTIFAYGVTSSGKTYTMQGPPDDPGVIPRVVEALFAKSTSLSTTEKTEIAVSYIEIYKDDVYDLLVARENAPKLPVRENETGAVFVAGLTSTPIASVAEFEGMYTTATARRSVGATLLNRASSRSHAVLTLTLRVRVVDPATGGMKVREGKINLVDLAGSENNKLTGNDPSRMAESAAINKSLSVLGQVVHALNTGAPRIPYRNAKLTRILQDALGGSSVGLLICNLSPAVKFRQDTLNTLNFAVRTKNIENKPVVNERGTDFLPFQSSLEANVPPADIRPPPPKIDLAHPPAPVPISKPVSALPPNRHGARPSLVPRPASRMSSFGLPVGTRPSSRMSILGTDSLALKENVKEKLPPGLTEAEIDARIAKAVEAEVARRLEEREREREMEREKERQLEREEKEAGSSRHRTKSPRKDLAELVGRSPKTKGSELPPGLTPLLKRHKDLDDELQARLAELERKFERGNRDAGLADVLSPVSKKKTGRAYVALARAHSEQGNLQIALDLYRRAETYVPDNVKLKERIIEIEWAVKNDRAFKPSPKRVKKGKKEKTKVAAKTKMRQREEGAGEEEMDVDGAPTDRNKIVQDDGNENVQEDAGQVSDDQMEVDEVETSLTGRAAFGELDASTIPRNSTGFGAELTNTGSKRSSTDAGMETPAKRPKRGAGKKPRVVVIESDEEDAEDVYGAAAAPRKRGKRAGLVGAGVA
ncbi:kinesin-like protein [Mycena leptocephala]|nr:kinesin-like protein [Mycena leptocephala]